MSSSSIPNVSQRATSSEEERSAQLIMRKIFGPPLPPPKPILGTDAEKRTVAGWMRLFASAQPSHLLARPSSNSSQLPPQAQSTAADYEGNGIIGSSNYQSADVFMLPQNRRVSPDPSSKLGLPNAALKLAILQANRHSIWTTFQNFKKTTEGELKERNAIIESLTDTVEACQAEVSELERQKEDYVSRESPLLKEIQEGIQSLLGKINSFVGTDGVVSPSSNRQQVNSLNGLFIPTPRSQDGRAKESQLTLNELLVKLKSLEDRTISIETSNKALLTTCKTTEENFKNYMMETSDRLDQIAGIFIAEKGRRLSSFSMQMPTSTDPSQVSSPVRTSQFSETNNCFLENEIVNVSDAEVTEIHKEEVLETILGNQEKQDEEPNISVCHVTIPHTHVETIFSSDSEQSPPPLLLDLPPQRQQCFITPQTNSFYEDYFNEQDEAFEATMEFDRGEGVETPNQENDESTTVKHSARRRNLLEEFLDDGLPPVVSPPCAIPLDSKLRWHTMPILLPEVAPLEPRPYFEDHINERRKKENREIAQRIKKIKSRKFGSGLERAKLTPPRIRVSKSHTKNAQGQMASEGARRVVVGIRKEKESGNLEPHHSRDFSKPGFACFCGSKFTGAGGLYVHLVKNMEYEKFFCNLCGKRFHYFSGLKAHRKSTHKLELTAEVGCSRCGQVFPCKKNRQGHRDSRGQTCWLSGSYQCKNWQIIRNKRVGDSSGDSSSSVLSV